MRVSDEFYNKVTEYTNRATKLFFDAVTVMHQENHDYNKVRSYEQLRVEEAEYFSFGYFPAPDNIKKRLARVKMFLMWTKKYVPSMGEQIDKLIEESKSLTVETGKTPLKNVEIMFHESKEAYEKYVSDSQS